MNETSMTEPQPETIVDPHGLLTSGAELATIHEIANTLGPPFSVTAVRMLLNGRLLHTVRHCRARPDPVRWHRSEALAALESHRAELEDRRRRAETLEREQRAAKEAKKAGKPAPSAKARIGELTGEMAKATPGRGHAGQKQSLVTTGNKSDALAAEGLSRKDAAECEKIASPSRGTSGPEVYVTRRSQRP